MLEFTSGYVQNVAYYATKISKNAHLRYSTILLHEKYAPQKRKRDGREKKNTVHSVCKKYAWNCACQSPKAKMKSVNFHFRMQSSNYPVIYVVLFCSLSLSIQNISVKIADLSSPFFFYTLRLKVIFDKYFSSR